MSQIPISYQILRSPWTAQKVKQNPAFVCWHVEFAYPSIIHLWFNCKIWYSYLISAKQDTIFSQVYIYVTKLQPIYFNISYSIYHSFQHIMDFGEGRINPISEISFFNKRSIISLYIIFFCISMTNTRFLMDF